MASESEEAPRQLFSALPLFDILLPWTPKPSMAPHYQRENLWNPCKAFKVCPSCSIAPFQPLALCISLSAMIWKLSLPLFSSELLPYPGVYHAHEILHYNPPCYFYNQVLSSMRTRAILLLSQCSPCVPSTVMSPQCNLNKDLSRK